MIKKENQCCSINQYFLTVANLYSPNPDRSHPLQCQKGLDPGWWLLFLLSFGFEFAPRLHLECTGVFKDQEKIKIISGLLSTSLETRTWTRTTIATIKRVAQMMPEQTMPILVEPFDSFQASFIVPFNN